MGESMVVVYDTTILSSDEIISTVENLGYTATIFNENSLKENKAQPDVLKKRFLKSF